jgi:hypothetical protein
VKKGRAKVLPFSLLIESLKMKTAIKSALTAWIVVFVTALGFALYYHNPAYAPPLVYLFVSVVLGGSMAVLLLGVLFIALHSLWSI